jgi:hypothetical protein
VFVGLPVGLPVGIFAPPFGASLRVAFDAIAPPSPGFVAPFDRRLCGRVPLAEIACGLRSRGVPEGARRAASDRPPASLVIAAGV